MNVLLDPEQVAKVTFDPNSRVNIPDETILDQVAHSIRRGLPQARPYEPNKNKAILVAGGPSLEMTKAELVQEVWKGGKVVCVNGAYQWCIDNNIKPSAMVMMDGREFNARFVETPVVDCNYLLASQCHPEAFEICRDRKTTIWHACSVGEPELEMLNKYYGSTKDRPATWPVTGGTTIGLRAISLMRMLGFSRMEIFGLDSCWLDDDHHAYRQSENDKDRTMSIWCRPEGRDDLAKRFICSVWHAKQAEDFLMLSQERGHLWQLNVHGPGLIATMVRTGAALEIEEN